MQILGITEGDACDRDGCEGVIERLDERNCSCHISPPCSNCVDAVYGCETCGWESEEDQ